MDAESLSAYDVEKLKRKARRAGEVAAAEKARELMPFSNQPPSLQKLAAWITTIDELRKFHKDTLSSNKEKVHSSVELWWDAQMRGGRVQGGVIRRTFNPGDLNGNFEQCCLRIAEALGSNSESDEIHEVRGGYWVLHIPSVEIVGKGMTERTFAYKKARGKFGDEIRSMRNVVSYVLTKDKEDHRDAEARRLDDQLAITVAVALGHADELKRVSTEAADKAYEDGEKELLNKRKKPEKEPKAPRPWHR